MAKNVFFLLSLLTLCSCQALFSSKVACEKTIVVGSVEVCLPPIDSMAECYSDSLIANVRGLQESDGNTILAYYMNKNNLAHLKQQHEMIYDDYFKVFIIDKIKDYKTDSVYLNQVAAAIDSTNKTEDWEEMQSRLQVGFDFIQPGITFFVFHYSPTEETRTFIMLYKFINQDHEEILTAVMNIMLIKERLVGLTYYRNYTSPATVSEARAVNDMIVRRVIDANKESPAKGR